MRDRTPGTRTGESDKRMADFDFAASPTLSKSLVLEMATCSFVAEKENWLLHGPTGVGKPYGP